MHDKKEISVFPNETVHLYRIHASSPTLPHYVHIALYLDTLPKNVFRKHKESQLPPRQMPSHVKQCTARCAKRKVLTRLPTALNALAIWYWLLGLSLHLEHQPRRQKNMNGLVWLLHQSTTLRILPVQKAIFHCIWILLLPSQPQPTGSSH